MIMSIEAEQAILGAAIYDNAALESDVKPEHFAEPLHARIWALMLEIKGKDRLAEPLALNDRLQGDDAYEEFGGLAYLSDLVERAPPTNMAPEYARQVTDAAKLRGACQVADQIRQMAHERKDPEAVIAEGERGLADLTRGEQAQFRAVGATALDMLERARNGATRGEPTGYATLDNVTGGIRPAEFWVIGGRASMGKAQPLDARVLLADGRWTTMGALRYGDKLASVDGAASRVVAIHPQGVKQVYRVTFSDGRSTEACADHLWTVRSSNWPAYRTLTTLEVAAVIKTVRHANKVYVPLVSGEFGVDQSLPVEPYVLGALIGDGGIKYGTRFTSADPEIVAQMEARIAPDMKMRAVAGTRFGYGLSAVERATNSRGFCERSSLRLALDELGIAGLGSEHKFIPPAYLSASRATRLDVLRGLMDTDGWAEKHGSVRYSTCSPQLAADVVHLVRSLGGICSIKEKATTFTYKGERRAGRPQYLCRIRHNDAAELFLLTRKRERACRARHAARLTITSIEPSREVEARCITVTHPSQLYVTDDYVVTHNSVMGLNLARGIAQAGRGVIVFSLEMTETEIQARMIADLAHDRTRYVNSYGANPRYGDILKGRGEPAQWEFAARGAKALASLPIVVNDTPGLTVDQIRFQAARQIRAWEKAGVRIGAVIVDHMGLIRPNQDRKGNTAAEMRDVSNGLKDAAKSLKAPIIAMAQINRDAEKSNDKRPTMAQLNWSGSVEQDAHFVGLLYREAYYLDRVQDRSIDQEAQLRAKRNELEMGIQKNRNGPLTTLKFYCDVASNVVRDVEAA